jgi:hypothetical protein
METATRRRALALVGSIAVSPKVAEAALVPTSVDWAILALGKEFEAAWARETALWTTCTGEESEDDESGVRRSYRATQALVERIRAMPARTLDGVRVKARTILWCRGSDTEEICDGAFGYTTDAVVAASIVRDLLAI